MDKVIEYGDVLNILQADEAERIVTRKEVPLFDTQAFKEAIVNAFVHNLWVDGNAPMITVYSDRLEILSRGKLPPKQTIAGFYLGESVPVNQNFRIFFYNYTSVSVLEEACLKSQMSMGERHLSSGRIRLLSPYLLIRLIVKR